MHRVIIADTSCLIVLSNIGELALLQHLYGQIVTTPEIAMEYGEPLPDWVEVVSVVDVYKQQLLELQIDKGESSAIALALETPDSTVILDDSKARRIADSLKLSYTGTMGVFVRAKLENIIPSIKPILEKIKKSNFRISYELELHALKAANE